MNNEFDTLYYHKNRLHLGLEKTSYTVFHLTTHEISRQLKIGLGKSTISYCKTPKYLGVTSDRFLTCKQHLFSLHEKVVSRSEDVHFSQNLPKPLGAHLYTVYVYEYFGPCIQHSRILCQCEVAQCTHKIVGHVHPQFSPLNHGVSQANYDSLPTSASVHCSSSP